MGDDLPYLDDGHDFSLTQSIDCGGSTCFEAIKYDSLLGRLHMKFKGGSNYYTWAGFPKGKFAAFKNAASLGRFYAREIRGNYHTNARL